MTFATPWAFLLLLAIPLLFLLRRRLGRRGSLRMSNAQSLKAAGVSTRQKFINLPFYLRLLALVALTIALARPQKGTERIEDHSKGIAIEMVLDRSGSMSDPMNYKGQSADRLYVAKEVFKDFVMGSGGLEGRPNDLVGLIAFARYADTVCPLTLGHEVLPQFLKQVHLTKLQNENGTAIGDAVALAAARLHNAGEEIKSRNRKAGRDSKYDIKSKVIILLTDGMDNASRFSVEQATNLCAQWGIKVYTIGIGDNQQAAPSDPFSIMSMLNQRGGVDINRLTEMAKATGGKFYLANSAESLKEVYEDIDKLEKTEITSNRYVDYAEKFMPFAIAGLVLLVLEIILSATVLRTAP